ncbi:hypothetical protein JFL43_12430 [Viridibacillus sp. YIM B01967]|uniref:Uncharacterized protein n=1 Tax=Viridibacillus soli TaxID=2798301 RepID=A0ABS1H8A3_9BACL|nr:hypothetical protein [Viridibacillus soli]MBK3495643.1 hypothetical protein [Viridibacillus soli]
MKQTILFIMIIVSLIVVATFTIEQKKQQQITIETEIGDKIIRKLESQYGSFIDYEWSDDNYEKYKSLVVYDVKHSQLEHQKFANNKTVKHKDFVGDTSMHQEIWQDFKNLFDQEYTNSVEVLEITTDGVGQEMAAVESIDDLNKTWTLYIDYQERKNSKDYYSTLIHEFGHLLTLRDDQTNQFSLKTSFCFTYQVANLCSLKNSYINQFYKRFWINLEQEWEEKKVGEDDYENLLSFYNVHSDEFVTDYAATNAEEDIAESWMYFILSLSDEDYGERVKFFYEYPELVKLRANILKKLAIEYPKSNGV